MFPLRQRKIGGYTFMQRTYYGTKHTGTDYEARYENYIAPFSGFATKGWGPEGGNWWQLVSGNKKFIARHLSKVLKVGQVNEGDLVAVTGNTGMFTTKPHLHQEVYIDNKLTDPDMFEWNPTQDPKLYQFGFVTTQVWTVPQIQEAIAMILTASHQRLKVDPVVKEKTFPDIPFVNGMVDANWYRQNILPNRMFHMSNSEWGGGLTNDEGWCTDDGIHFRADEKQTMYFPGNNREVKEFVANFVHELCHWICRTTGQPDITHQYMSTALGIFDPEGAYSRLDYSKLK